MADLHYQPAARLQMRGGLMQDAAYQVESVSPAMQCERGLVPVFRRQPGHHRFAHIRRIGEDQVVAFSGKAGEQVGAEQADALCQCVPAHIAARHGECSSGNIDGIDPRMRKRMRGYDRQAA